MQQIKEADRNPAYPSISIAGAKHQKNFCGGILGIIFWLILLVLLIKKSITVFGKSQVTVQTFIQRDQSQISISSRQSAMAVLVSQYNPTNTTRVGPKSQYAYGFEVTMVQYLIWYNYTDQKVYNDVKLALMVACPEDEDLFCVPEEFSEMKIECQFEKVGPFGCPKAHYYDIFIRECPHDKEGCADEIAENLVATFGFFDNTFDVFQPKTQDVIHAQNRAFFLGVEFEDQNQYVFRVYFSKLDVQTDQSIFPSLLPVHSLTTTTTWFYPNMDESFLDNSQHPRHRYMQIQLRRSYTTEKYKRSFEQIDTMLAEILGFMGLIAWAVGVCCGGYNGWLMEEWVADKKQEVKEGVLGDGGEDEQGEQGDGQMGGEKIKKKKSFIQYCKVKVLGICTRNPQQHYPQQKEIDLIEMYKKITQLQKEVQQLKSQKSMPIPPQPQQQPVQSPQIHQLKQKKQPTTGSKKQELKESLLSQDRLT